MNNFKNKELFLNFIKIFLVILGVVFLLVGIPAIIWTIWSGTAALIIFFIVIFALIAFLMASVVT